jgi:hypothetical protein
MAEITMVGIHGPVPILGGGASSAALSEASVTLEITRTTGSPAPTGLTTGRHEYPNKRLVDVEIHEGDDGIFGPTEISSVLRCELFAQNKDSGGPSGKVTVEDTGASVIISSTDNFDDENDQTNFKARTLALISRIVVTQTDGEMHTARFNRREWLSLTFGLKDLPAY